MDDADSIMIDLDPEVGPARPRLPWEVLLGVILLISVLGFAGGDWWHTEQQARAYQQGQAAQQARHWDAATAAFAAAGDYQNAAQLWAEAQAQTQRRDALLRNASLGDVPTAWRALRTALTIEPDYPGLAAREAQARTLFFAQATAGLVYLQPEGTPPGLYWTSPAGETQYLPRSDEESRLRGIAPEGRAFLYDAAPLPPPDTCRGPCLPSRPIMWSTITPEGALTTRVVPGALPAAGNAVFTRDGAGFWWIAGPQAWYFDGATATLTVLPTTAPPRQLLAVDPVHKRVLLSNASAGAADTMLYLAQADGTAPSPLFIVQDRQVVSAVFTADGTRVVCTMQKVGTEVSRTVWLVDVLKEGATATQVMVVDWIAWAGLQTVARLNAFAAPSGPVLIDLMDQRGEEVAQVDPHTGVRTILWTGPGQVRHYEAAAVSSTGGALAFHEVQEHKSALVVLPLDGSGPARTFTSPTYGDQTIQARFAPHSDYLLYQVRNPDGVERGATQPIYTLPLTAATGTAPRLLATARMPYDLSLETVALPPGGDLLAYVAETGDLRAALFDGTADTLIADGVTAVWSLRDPTPLTWIR